MAYVSAARLQKALDSLPRFHAFFGVSFLSMKKEGVGVGEPVKWGSAEEQKLLAHRFSPAGRPPGKPYFVPFGKASEDSGYWKNPKYSGGTLQRARTTDNFRPALVHPSKKSWAFAGNYLDVLEEQLPKHEGDVVRLPAFDLIAWIYHDEDLPPSFEEILKKFRTDFGLDDDAEFERLFDAEHESEALVQFFHDEPIDRDELIRLLRGVPEGPKLGDLNENAVVTGLEDYVREEAILNLPEGFVTNLYYSLKTQRFVVLGGRPGTGKTALAHAFSDGLELMFPETVHCLTVSVGQDFGEADVLGYEKLAGGLAPTELANQLFLSERPRDIYVVILDEMNMAQVDYYLARILPAIESDSTVELPGLPKPFVLPPDAFFIGTVNSFVEEATRLPLSAPVKRRSNLIEMPNPLDEVIAKDDPGALSEQLVMLLKQARKRSEERETRGLPSVFDGYRIANIDAALQKGANPLPADLVDCLLKICRVCAANPQTSLTLGVLQDMVEYVVLSGWDPPLLALDRQVAQKLVPQLSGPASVAKQLMEVLENCRTEAAQFKHALSALGRLLGTEDVGSGMVFWPY